MSVPLPPGFVLDEQDNNGLPPGFVIDVVSQGGPRSLMGAKLDEIDPNGADRRFQGRMKTDTAFADLIDPEGAQQRRLQRGRTSLDMKARMGPLGSIYMGLDALGRMDGPVGDVSRQGQKMMRGATGSPLEGALFSFDDEIAGLLGGDEAKQRRRDEQLASRTDTPVTNFVGNLAGGVVSPANKVIAPLAGIKTTAQAANAGRLTLSQMALQGSKAGAIGGGLYGAGAAEGDAQPRLDDAAWGMIYGAAGGAVLGAGVGAGVNKFSTGKFLPGQSAPDILNMSPEAFGKTGAANLLRTALRRSDVPSKDVDSAIGDAVRLFQMSGNGGNRPLTLAQALERTLEQKGYAQAAGNVKSIFQQLQASRPGQGMSQVLDDMAGSQEAYITSALDDTLGPATLAKERGRIRGEQRAIGDAQEEAINQARSLNGNEEGSVAMQRLVENARNDPNPTVTSWLNRAARDMGVTQTGAGPGAKAVPAFENAIKGDPLGFAKQLVRSINGARKNGAQLDAVTMNLLDEAQQALNAATKFTRGPGGRFGYNKMGSFNEGQQKFRLTYEELDAQTQKFMSLARDPVKRADFMAAMESAPEQVKSAVRTRIKEDIAAALRNGNVDEVAPYLGGLRNKGLHDDLAAFLGEDGKKISQVLRNVLDEQNWIKSTDARRLNPADRTSVGKNPDIKNIYTANPLTRLANKTPIMTTLVGDVATGAFTGTPALTAAKVIGHLTGPRGASVRQLAQTLALRAGQGGTNAGRLSRMPPVGAAGASGAASQAQQGAASAIPAPAGPAPLRTSQRAPWSPVQVPAEQPTIVPRVQTNAQRTADRLRQKAVDARQRAADATARAQDEAAIRQTRIEAQQAEAAARAAEAVARNEARISRAVEKALRKSGRDLEGKIKSQGKEEQAIAAREAAAKLARQDAERGLDKRLDLERRANAAAKAEAEALKDRSLADRIKVGSEDRVNTYTSAQKIEAAKKNAVAGVDPVRTFEDTGHLALTIGDKPVVVLDVSAKSSDDLVRMLARVEDDILGANRNKPDKWSNLTRMLWGEVGEDKLVREIMKGEVPGWRTPAERARADQFRTAGKITAGVAATGLTVAGAAKGYQEVNRTLTEHRLKAIVQDKATVQVIQRALKAAKQYEGRADGKYDSDVQIAVAQFQGTHGLGKTSDPGDLDMKTLKKLEEYLVFEGKTKLADEIRDIRLNKKSKEK